MANESFTCRMTSKRRLIDANELKWKISVVRLYVNGLRFGKTVLGKILESYRSAVFEEINNAPTVDAVEVVRCKDCKHWQICVDGVTAWCPLLMDKVTKADDFCSYGERRNDGSAQA